MKGRLPVVVLVGATGTGKSGVAHEWARRYPVEIVNADASQVYRGMDIGTATPSAHDQIAVPHHLFNIVDPDDPLDAGRYVELAEPVIDDIVSRGKLPLFVGGTGLYVKALLFGLAEIPEVPVEVRASVQAELERVGPHALHTTLEAVDAEAASRISPNDPQRITRALEVYRHTSSPITMFQQRHGFTGPLRESLIIGLDVERETHRKRLAIRIEAMFAQGFIPEVEQLLAAGWPPTLRSFKALGYQVVMDLLAGKLKQADAVAQILTQHARYAKRQRTWFAKMEGVHWCSDDNPAEGEALLGAFLQKQIESKFLCS
jgi:tRNA dimethylallyltransferase